MNRLRLLTGALAGALLLCSGATPAGPFDDLLNASKDAVLREVERAIEEGAAPAAPETPATSPSPAPATGGSPAIASPSRQAIHAVHRRVKLSVSSGLVLLLDSDGTVLVMGRNHYGQADPATRPETLERFKPVAGLPKAIDVAVLDDEAALVLGVDGLVYSWGRNRSNRLGPGENWLVERTTPEPVVGLDRVKNIAGCGLSAAAVREDGTVWMWGEDTNGLISGQPRARPGFSDPELGTPRQVAGIDDVVDIGCGSGAATALRADGTVWTWGENDFGQLGLGDTEPRHRPTQVPGLKGVTAIHHHASAARLADGSWLMWAYALPVAPRPTESARESIPPVLTPTPAHESVRHARTICGNCALLEDGSVRTWGRNDYGQLGTGGSGDDFGWPPVEPKGLGRVKGLWFGFALQEDGRVMAWSWSAQGTNLRTPTEVWRLDPGVEVDPTQ